MTTLVITSLNPFARVEYQLRCFNEWAAIGYDIQTFNSSEEYEILIDNGLPANQLKKIPPEDTAELMFDKPIPRILPLLESALLTECDCFILTNSDIYPTQRKVISDFLAKSFDSVAFTRTECSDLSISRFNPQYYYRGGLDLFWFTKAGLQRLVEKLRKSRFADRMTFGIPGWDFYLGHLLCTQMDAPITDGSVFLHQSHNVSYANIDEFGYFASEMIQTGLYSAQDPASLAIEFATFIKQKCQDSRRLSKLLKLAFYRQPILHSKSVKNEDERPGENQEILEHLSDYLVSANVTCAYSDLELEIFTAKQCKDRDWNNAIRLMRNHENRYSIRMRRIQLLLLSLLCAGYQKAKTLTLSYPIGSMHTPALKQIMADKYGKKQEFSIFNLFAGDLVNYNIVNLNLLKHLFTAADDSDEKALLAIIISICKKGLAHA